MAPSPISQRRTRNLLLFQKLLNLRDGASPFTLILDNLEQSALPAVTEFMSRAKISKTKVVFISFETLRKPKNTDVFIKARGRPIADLRLEIAAHLPAPQPGQPAQTNKTLLIIDTLYHLASSQAPHLAAFLSSLLGPSISLLAIYHVDVPLGTPRGSNEYAPNPLTLLTYLATAILKVSSLAQTLEKKRARDRSLPDPDFGLAEEREGVLFGMNEFKGHSGREGEAEGGGVVIGMEVRRRSGRGVREVFVLFKNEKEEKTTGRTRVARGGSVYKICLLDDHPLYAPPNVGGVRGDGGATGEEEGVGETTFSLGLTEKQRRDREGIVLPYFDAQNGEGAGEGGRILYEMDRGDDFDEEEDEI